MQNSANSSVSTVQPRYRAPTASHTLKHANRARSAMSSPRKLKPRSKVAPAAPVSPSRRAITRSTRAHFNLKLHSPIKQQLHKPSYSDRSNTVTEADGASSSDRHLPSSNPLLFSRANDSVFGSSNLFAKGLGAGFSPERSPVRRRLPCVDQSPTAKRSTVVINNEDNADLSFEIASPQKRTAKTIFASSQPSSSTAALIDPVPVGVSTKRRRDAAFGVAEEAALRSPAKKRVAFQQPGSVSPSSSHKSKHSAGKPDVTTELPLDRPPTCATSLFPELSRSGPANLSHPPGVSKRPPVSLAAPLPIRTCNPFAAPSPLDAIPESPQHNTHSAAPSSPIRRPQPPKRSRSLTDITFAALAEDSSSTHQRSQLLPSPLLDQPHANSSLPSFSLTTASSPFSHSRTEDFLEDSYDLRAPPIPPSFFPHDLDFWLGDDVSDDTAAMSYTPLPVSNSPDSALAGPFWSDSAHPPLLPAFAADLDDTASDQTPASASDESTSFSNSDTFSTEGMTPEQIAKLHRLQSMVSRLKPCRRLSTALPQPTDQPQGRLRSGNNAGADSSAAHQARPRQSVNPRRGSLLEQVSLSSASRILDQQQHSPASPTSPENSLHADSLPLHDVIAFVDVRTSEGDDASSVFIDMLKSLGARVMSRHTPAVTHIIYKGGRPATLERVKTCRPRPHVVGIGWVVRTKEAVS